MKHRITETAGDVVTRLLDHLLPRRCSLCLQLDDGGFCDPCQQLLPWTTLCCERCSVAMKEPGICGHCQNSKSPWDRLLAACHYRDPVARHLQLLKYHGRLHHATALGTMLALYVIKNGDSMPQALIPVPLHPSRLRQRGYNQADLLAQQVGSMLSIPVDRSLLKRVHNTPSQTTLDESQRAKNMQNAFAVNAMGRYDAVAVIDDVITSGATMHAACIQLRRSGIAELNGWAIARA